MARLLPSPSRGRISSAARSDRTAATSAFGAKPAAGAQRSIALPEALLAPVMTILMGSTSWTATAGILLTIQHVKQNDCPTRRQLQLGVFLKFRFIDGCSLGRIGYKGQSAIVQLMTYFDSYMGISGHVLVPAPAVRVREPRGIKGIQVELPLIGDTIDSYG